MGLWGTLVWIVWLLCAVWVIYDVFTHQKKMKNEYKIIWTIAAIIFGLFTAIAYYFIIQKK